MNEVGAVVVSVLMLAGFSLCVGRAFFVRDPSRSRYRTAALAGAFLAVYVIGCAVCGEYAGAEAARWFGAVCAIAAFALVPLLTRMADARDTAAAVAYLQTLRAAERARERMRDGSASDVSLTCALAARAYDLTRREEEILALLLEGKSFAAVAGELVVSENTVKTHVRNLYRKMGVNRKQDLAARVEEASRA